MNQWEVDVELVGTVTVTVEAETENEARELAKENAEIGEVNSWRSYVLNIQET